MNFLTVIVLFSTLVAIIPPASGKPKHFLVETEDGPGGDYQGGPPPPIGGKGDMGPTLPTPAPGGAPIPGGGVQGQGPTLPTPPPAPQPRPTDNQLAIRRHRHRV